MVDITYLQAVVIGLLQGVTELFPISSLGHSVLVPAWLGGDWSHLVTEYGTSESSQSPYLAFIVALHVATAFALLWFYRRDWIAIITGFLRTLRNRRIETSTERLAWLIVIATIPVGITGLVLEHTFRVLFAKPVAAAAFLTLNGLILLAGEWLRRRADRRTSTEPSDGRSHDTAGANELVYAWLPTLAYEHHDARRCRRAPENCNGPLVLDLHPALHRGRATQPSTAEPMPPLRCADTRAR